ncbi:Regulation of nuclear pre-mRNA domain-containing protein 1B-like isoform X2 [Oopsacas minuta]|uniref:Regulation of nuclear pre-mRNA domain-containing protein 1B-like isoform X2 n=1 Tax=Oopsacas minuta TaxID=111878 RepID=A0AAV7J8K4_9METZ|nr:Regulation of nuclear pre-mRNA domain-containing protein 1B-like isoform X2 [Oopsacas minuta]
MSSHERFSSSALDHRLRDLTNSQHSIEALSVWVVKHRKHARTAVEIWLKEICKARPSRKLTLLFLSNDIVQNSRKKGTELNREFTKVMYKALQISYKEEDLQLTQGIQRLVSIWEERSTFPSDLLQRFRSLDSQYAKLAKDHPPAPQDTGRGLDALRPTREAPEYSELISALHSSEHQPSGDVNTQQEISNLVSVFQDSPVLAEVGDREEIELLLIRFDHTATLIKSYTQQLQRELEEKQQLQEMLIAFLSTQKLQSDHAIEKLQEQQSRLDHVSIVHEELVSHIANLPDLSLPAYKSGLDPLPSVGDLFQN